MFSKTSVRFTNESMQIRIGIMLMMIMMIIQSALFQLGFKSNARKRRRAKQLNPKRNETIWVYFFFSRVS